MAGDKLCQKDHTLKIQGTENTNHKPENKRESMEDGRFHCQQLFCLHPQEENYIPWESGSITIM